MEEYEFGVLEDRIISLCEAARPDYEAICRQIEGGANVNAVNKYGQAFLSKILLSLEHGNKFTDIVKTVLLSGFDSKKLGLRCIESILFTTYDKYFFSAAKLLLESGATGTDEQWASLLKAIGTEESYQRCCAGNHKCENIYYPLYEIVAHARKGLPYSDIALWSNFIGRKVESVLSYSADSKPVSLLKNSKFEIPDKIFFLAKTKTLIIEANPNIYTRANPVPTLDMTKCIPVKELRAVVGAKVKRVSFKHEEVSSGFHIFRQPNIYVSFDNGIRIRFSTNFGEVPEGTSATYFEIVR